MLGQTRLHPRLCNFYEHTVQENEKQKEKHFTVWQNYIYPFSLYLETMQILMYL